MVFSWIVGCSSDKGCFDQQLCTKMEGTWGSIDCWTVNNSLERVYLERVLHITVMSDTLDEIGIEEILK